jgi:hypothetical protein
MLIKNGRTIMDRILKPRQFKIWIRSAPAVAFLGSCALLLGAPLYAQDLLLKEYIYLDGKLLAVERQVLTQVAQQSASESGMGMKFAQYLPPGIHGLTPAGSNCKPGISVNSGLQEICAFHGAGFAQFPFPGKGQSRFVGREDFKLQYGTHGWHPKFAGISEYKNGGSDDGL